MGLIKPSNVPENFHLPTDLSGIYLGEYDSKRTDNIGASVSPFCTQISQQIFNQSKYPLSLGYKHLIWFLIM